MGRTVSPISTTTRNLILKLTETIAQSLKITSCNICGETNIGNHWPWEARELDPQEPHNETIYCQPATMVWLLKTSVIGKNCLS
jgi:hypothetical protein